MNREDEICLALQGLINCVVKCASCQSKFEAANPDSVARKVQEKFGTRDDFKNMRGRQFGVNVQNKG